MMPAWMLRASCVIALAMTIVGCKSTRDKPEVVEGSETSEEGPTYLIGMIELVNPEQKFVLIRVQGSMNLPAGHELSALDATGSWSELKISPEKKGHHLTADITSGTPRVGNLVVYRPKTQTNGTSPSKPTAAPPPTPDFQQPPPIAPWDPATGQPIQPPPIAPLNTADGLPTQPPPIAPLTSEPRQPTQPPPIAPINPVPLDEPGVRGSGGTSAAATARMLTEPPAAEPQLPPPVE